MRGNFFPFFKKKFIYFWPCWVLVGAHGLSLVVVGLRCFSARGVFPDQGLDPCALHCTVGF